MSNTLNEEEHAKRVKELERKLRELELQLERDKLRKSGIPVSGLVDTANTEKEGQ